MMIINVYNYNFAKLEKKFESARQILKKDTKIFCRNDFPVYFYNNYSLIKV